MFTGSKPQVAGGTRRVVLDQDTVTADAQGSGVDVTDLIGLGLVLVTIGVPANADNTIEAQLQESTDDAAADAYEDIAGATTGIITSDVATVEEIVDVDLDAAEDFIRVSYENVAGTSPSYEVAVVLIAGAQVLPNDP
jgi:hypothetical protein